VVVIWQVTWFIITELERLRQGLPMTTLELTALSFSFMMIVTTGLWYHKPTIVWPVPISTRDGRTIEQIRAKARETSHPALPHQRHRTPLYFISRPRYQSDVLWTWLKELSYKLHCPVFGRPITPVLWDRIPNDLWHPVSNKYIYVLGSSFQTAFSLSLLAAWNFYFPSTAERVIWGFAVSFHGLFSFGGGIFIFYNELSHMRKNRRYLEAGETDHADVTRLSSADDIELRALDSGPTSRGLGRLRKLWGGLSRRLARLTNISPTQDPDLSIGLSTTLPSAVLAAVYILCRLFISVEDFVSMRSQAQGIYVTVGRFLLL
jgi:hypothetical protein